MKRKNNLIRLMLMSITSAMTFGFVSCSDEISDDSSATSVDTNSGTFEALEQYSYYVPVNVNINGDWKAELKFEKDDYLFCYLNRTEGKGPATIKLCVLDNWTNKRNNARLVITDLKYPKNSQTIPLRQKCNLDNANYKMYMTRASAEGENGMNEEAAPVKDKGDIVKAVGYGYNVNLATGVKAISSRPIIALELLRDEGNGYGPQFRKGEFSINIESYAASNIMSISDAMSATTTLKGTASGFNAEASATFTRTQKSGTNNLYCLTIANVNVGQAVLQGIDRNNVRKYMTPAAKQAIDGTGSSYPTSFKGFRDLIEDYGSHLILSVDLGGRLRYGATIDKHYCNNTNELKAHASMNYKNKIMEANAKVSNDYKSTYENTKNYIVKNVSASGGGFKETAIMTADDNTTNVNAWINSLENEENLAVINFNQPQSMQMWPLYMLVDTSTPEGQRRYNLLKEYMEESYMESDFYVGTETYAKTDVVRLNFPSDWTAKADGKHADFNGTLIREARHEGKTVAWYCMEYIPQISCEGLVPVVYPVVNNKPNFQAGRFLGTDKKFACDICWTNKGTITMSNYAAEKGLQPTLYLSAKALYTTKPRGDAMDSETRDMVLKAPKMNSDVSITVGLGTHDFWKSWGWDESWIGKDKTTDYNYPLVKIGTHVWTRENYNGKVPHGTKKYNRYGTKVDKGQVFYTFESLKNSSFPVGWHPGKSAEYQELKAITTYECQPSEIGSRLQKDGVTGFNMSWTGWYTYDLYYIHDMFGDDRYHYYDYNRQGNGDSVEYLLPGSGHVCIRSDKFDICPNEKSRWGMQIRLVMDI